MNYRSVSDMRLTIIRNLERLPGDVDLVVGIPRSGLLPALLIALYKNIPVTDIDGFLEGRVIGSGQRSVLESCTDSSGPERVLVVDDSIHTGREIRRAKKRIAEAGVTGQVVYCSVYGANSEHEETDIVLETVTHPRTFEWNIMHSWVTPLTCMDMDGVLCRDPRLEETSTEKAYLDFLVGCEPKIIPTSRGGWVVTSRFEKYRRETETWLKRNGVKYDRLVMWDYKGQTKPKERHRATYKAQIYRGLSAILFVESSKQQSIQIARLTGKPVFCVENQEMMHPWSKARGRTMLKNGSIRGYRALRRAAARVTPMSVKTLRRRL